MSLIRKRNSDSLSGSSVPALVSHGVQVHDEIFKLVQRIFVTNGSGAPRFIVFAGVDHGSGCSSVCARVGEILAANGDSMVCLIDANPIEPGLFAHFGVKPARRLAALEPDSPMTVRQPDQSNGNRLRLMSWTDGLVGRYVSNMEKFRARLLEYCSAYGYILVDAPPLNSSVHSLMLGRIADGVVLVLEANATRRDAALRAKEILVAEGIRILGAVLNKRHYPIPDSIYRKI